MSDGTPIIIKKVKGRAAHAHHGGSWKVAYADFVTAMMAFFMVMWIMGLSDETRAQVQGYFNDPLGFRHNEPKTHSMVVPKSSPGSQPKSNQNSGAGKGSGKADTTEKDADKLAGIRDKIRKALEGDKELKKALPSLEMTITQDGLRIELVESMHAAFFKSSSAELSPIALKFVNHIAPILRQQDRTFIVEGHTDSVPYPDPSYTNWDLSSDRANALRRALFAAGLNPRRCSGVRALADTELKVASDPTSYRNRRVTILLPYKADRAPGSKMPKDLLPSGDSVGMGDVVLKPRVGPK
jgi:chemotaxis protein MotB